MKVKCVKKWKTRKCRQALQHPNGKPNIVTSVTPLTCLKSKIRKTTFEASPGFADGELLGQGPVKVWGFGVLPGNLDGKRVQELFPLVLTHLGILKNVANFI